MKRERKPLTPKSIVTTALLSVISLCAYAQTDPVDTVTDISALQAYNGTAKLLVVTDPGRGGLFYKHSTGPADDGVIFTGATGYWYRRYDRANGINVRWYGPSADGVTNDVAKIQAAVDRAAADTVQRITMNGMHLRTGATIFLPSDITLDAEGSYIELLPGANCDMLRNADLANGNKNIKISGGVWNGHGWQQIRTISGTVAASSFCFGMFFYRCENIEVSGLEIDSTRSWGIAAMEADHIYVHDIRFQQNPYKQDGSVGLAENGDGFTFGANNVLVENISGFTNDDMIAVGAGGAIFSGVQAPFAQRDYENITIRDIVADAINDSIPTWRAVGLYAINGRKVTNVTVSNVSGVTTGGKVIIANPLGDSFGGGLGYFDNIYLNNINGSSRTVAGFSATQFGIISVAAADVNKLIVTGGNRSGLINTSHIKTTDSTIIRELNVSNINIQSAGVLIRLVEDGARIGRLNISNINLLDSLGLVGQRLYDRATSPFNADTIFIRVANSHITRPPGFSTISIGGGKVSFSSTSVIVVDTTSFSPVEGNVMITENLGLVNYKSGRWIGTGAGYFTTYSNSPLVFSTNRIERGRFANVGTFILGTNSGERMSARFNALSFNRNVSDGTIFSNAGHAYQWGHTASTTNTSDVLALSVYNTAGGAVATSALSVNGAANIGVRTTTQTAALDINGVTGYNQLRLRKSYTPAGTADPNGNVGDLWWDDNFIYIKTPAGVKRAALSTF